MVVLDSSFLIACHNTRDVHHAAAAQAMSPLTAGRWDPVLLPEYVLLEVVTVLLIHMKDTVRDADRMDVRLLQVRLQDEKE